MKSPLMIPVDDELKNLKQFLELQSDFSKSRNFILNLSRY